MAENGEIRDPKTHRTPKQMKRHIKGYSATPKQKANRAARGRARTAMRNKLGEAAIKGKDIGHKNPLSKGGSNSTANLQVQSVKSNRGHGMSKNPKPKRK